HFCVRFNISFIDNCSEESYLYMCHLPGLLFIHIGNSIYYIVHSSLCIYAK
ncbi:hypothetical protein L9F63_002115, partial [Diploptera punctata]